jgi:hypothetical protein
VASIGACGWGLEGLSGGSAGGPRDGDGGGDGPAASSVDAGAAPLDAGGEAGARTTLTIDPPFDDKSASQDLTSDGPLDWVQWTQDHRERCLSCVERIGPLLATTPMLPYMGDARTFSWSNGTPDATGTASAGTYIEGVGSEIDFTIGATPSPAVFTFHADTYYCAAALTAQFSGSPVTQTVPAQQDSHWIALRIHLASDPPQLVHVSWKLTSLLPVANDTPNLAVIAATLLPEL